MKEQLVGDLVKSFSFPYLSALTQLYQKQPEINSGKIHVIFSTQSKFIYYFR